MCVLLLLEVVVKQQDAQERGQKQKSAAELQQRQTTPTSAVDEQLHLAHADTVLSLASISE